MRSLGLLPFVIAMSACSLTPSMVMPPLPVPAAFPDATDRGHSPAAAMLDWQTAFIDPRLRQAIGLALSNNRDLRLAMLNVEIARSQYGIARAAKLPAIDATVGSVRQRGGDTGMATPGTTGQHTANMAMQAFEIDLFGRVHALSEAAFARYLATEAGFSAARLALIAAVADAYLADRFSDAQLALAERTLEDWRQSLSLALSRHAAGQSGGLDVAQAQSQLAGAQADVEARQRERAHARHALMLLVGAELPPDAARSQIDSDPLSMDWPTGLPADLLARRPDIVQAERRLVAANADIGAARAAFFPRLSLTASHGYASTAMESLFKGGGRAWSFAPQAVLPIFHHGRLRAELRVAELRKSSEVAEYEKAIQTAFREVADGLAGRRTYQRQRAAQQAVVASAEQRAALSDMRYRAGVEGRLELLDAQRQLYAARQAMLELRRAEYANTIALYKAIGGGMPAADRGP
ncbi:efflux transporter outer membrane subunit [Massilia sp. G4R7]|uniref:Efflux transporter outer membrane subunit n=1 Tax=Massilia phyllostachyos TaxID=2898585 RepID=A0ABS8Q1M4_9BURK|nr:efflux transporter outer membrane subunit [Massilia phyllostachyos]MCD2515637.1 efflux transporter outer membrane subunit [Massilia phyllostachyos]